MAASKRRRFRGDVSVDISLDATGHGSVPSSGISVKRYLDAMQGLVYDDDKQVAHLVVHRFADDWPGRLRRAAGLPGGPSRLRSRGPARADVFVSPIRVFAHDWERPFRLGADPGYTDAEASADFTEAWRKLTKDNWTEADDDRLDELLGERRLDRQGRGWLARLPDEMAAVQRGWRDEDISGLLERRMLDEMPEAPDHPLGHDPVFDSEPPGELGIYLLGPRPRWNLPAHFWLPLEGAETAWVELVHQTMREHRDSWPVLPKAFERAVALDIAAFGATVAAKDVDNLARVVVSAFELQYCGGKSGTVVSYRAYRRPSDKPGIRVLVMAAERFTLLWSAVEEARSAVLRGGFHNRRRALW